MLSPMQNASQTSRLSSHYSSLLAQREAVIEELATQETDLKHALQEKALKECQLKQDKTLLLTANRALQERLGTTLRSDSGSGLSSSAEGGELSEGEGEGRVEPDVGRGEGEGLRTEKEAEGAWQGVVTSPNASLRLNIMQEMSEDELKQEVKYFPPKK